jgi:hypothetical protein
MKLDNAVLVDLLRKAYSAEKAASFAYQGHAASVKDPGEKSSIRQIELDEWNHRREVLSIMKVYNISPSRWYEFKFHIIGKIISYSCHILGWFMPFYFAGRLESGNVCEYFRMMRLFYEMGITDHNDILYEMGIKEKEHEIYFLGKIRNKKLLPFFEKIFSWGPSTSYNNVDLEEKYPIEEAKRYCRKAI